MGRKRKSDHLKILHGTDRPDRMAPDDAVEFEAVAAPAAPHWMTNPDALAKWKELVEVLTHARVLTVGDLTKLEITCDLYGAIVQKRLAGVSAPISAYTRLQGLLSDFGLDPANRHRVSAIGGGAEANPFMKHGKRA